MKEGPVLNEVKTLFYLPTIIKKVAKQRRLSVATGIKFLRQAHTFSAFLSEPRSRLEVDQLKEKRDSPVDEHEDRHPAHLVARSFLASSPLPGREIRTMEILGSERNKTRHSPR